jgi:hypothetical protein
VEFSGSWECWDYLNITKLGDDSSRLLYILVQHDDDDD